MTEEKVNYPAVRQPQSMALETMADLMTFGKVMVESGMFPDLKSQAQAVVKIVAGRELGLAPLYSLRKLYVINGQVTLSADVMANLIKRSGEYDYQVMKLDDTGCAIQFFKNGATIGPVSTFTMDDAKAAGLAGGNWSKFRRNMLFARAISNGARWYCPHIIGGAYTPDEMGGAVNAEGDVVAVPAAVPVVVMETGEILPPNGQQKAIAAPTVETSPVLIDFALYLASEELPTLVDPKLAIKEMGESLAGYGFAVSQYRPLVARLQVAMGLPAPTGMGNAFWDRADARIITALADMSEDVAASLKTAMEV